MLTVALVVMVIFLFLRSLAATIIPSVAVPLSLVGTFGVMYLLGYSLNNLTLMALTISTGFVVDDAIVMIENITRYIEEGETPLRAALKGSEQIGFTIISLTVSLIAVLIPLLFMGDMVGPPVPRVRRHAGVTILVSAVVSLTLTPMMCARAAASTSRNRSRTRFYRKSEQCLQLRHRASTAERCRCVLRYQLHDPAGHRRHLGPHRCSCTSIIPRASSRSQDTGVDSGHLRGAAEHLVPGHGAAPAAARRRHPEGPGRRKASPPSSASTAPTRRSTAAASRSI